MSGSSAFFMALGCMHLPGPSRSGSGTLVVLRGADSVGPAFCALPRSEIEKAEEPEIKLPTCAGSWKKEESSRKTSISALLHAHGDLTSLAPHERLPELPVIPREKPIHANQ